jgi:hypothetical protein
MMMKKMMMKTMMKNTNREGKMKRRKIAITITGVFLLLAITTIASAADFDWLKDFSVQAQLDPSGFKARLATRFNIGDAQVSAVLSNVPDPGEAYMVMRLGEMSSKPTEFVIEQYKSGKNKGWGALAKSLGIKPGSSEFKALKKGGDLDKAGGKQKNSVQEKGQGKGKGKNKGK